MLNRAPATFLDKGTRAVNRVRAAPPGARWSTAHSIMRSRARRSSDQLLESFFSSQVRAVETAFGSDYASRYFWSAPFGRPSWDLCAARLHELDSSDSDAIARFVRLALDHTTDPIVIANLARHPLSKDAMGCWLETQVGCPSNSLVERCLGNRLLGAAATGAAHLLLGAERAEQFGAEIVDLYQIPDSRFFQFVDSFGYRPADSHRGRPDRAGPHHAAQKVRHRLVIAEQFGEPDSVALLLPDSERTTLIATSETFGHGDFSDFDEWPDVGEVVVEHTRTRITRFSQSYIDLHEATATVAHEITSRVLEIPELNEHVDGRFLSVEIADFLFFQALAIRALEVLVDDPDFDEIVLAFDDPARSVSFIQLLRRVTGLLADPRLTMVSISKSPAARAGFWSIISALDDQPPVAVPRVRRVPDSLVLRKLGEDAIRLAAMLPRHDEPGIEKSVVLVTNNNPRYNESTAGYFQELRHDHDVQIIHIGSEADDLTDLLAALDGGPPADVSLLAPAPDRMLPAGELIVAHLQRALPETGEPSDPAERASRAALEATCERLAAACIAPSIARMKALHHWLAIASADDSAPDVIVVTPHRAAGVGVIEVIARRFGIPTVAVEPHAQDANYSRYTKVLADYYGVMSNYFKGTASTGFDIDLARVRTIGSPRQIAPPGYDPLAEQRRARQRYERERSLRFDEHDLCLVYFCQPSDWSHVTRVFANVLEAGRRTRCPVFLKPHPEESSSRIEQYMKQAAQVGLEDEMVLLDGDAHEAVALADIVLTGYSSSAFDAALRQKPVICVTDGDLPYPIDISAIVDAPRARSADELATIITEWRSNPETMRRRARSLIDQEHQFVDGPGPRLRRLIADVLASGADALRDESDLPPSLFLDGPHPVFPV